MIAVLLLLLLVVWAAVLIPPWIRSRAEHSPRSSIAGFSHRLSILASRARDSRPLPGFGAPIPVFNRPAFNGYASPYAVRKNEAQRRRTLILEGLLIVGGCTFVLGLLPPLRFFLFLFVLDLVAFAGYVALLLQWKRNRAEHTQKLRDLPQLRAMPSYAAAERQAR